jgi:quercetin dioxygenase-like cupin family protein
VAGAVVAAAVVAGAVALLVVAAAVLVVEGEVVVRGAALRAAFLAVPLPAQAAVATTATAATTRRAVALCRGTARHYGPSVHGMDVRSIVDVEPEVEHNGTVPVWYFVHPREMKDRTDGGYLELINEFEVAAGGHLHPHSHPTHEWYFVMNGRGVMTVAGEVRDVIPGVLVYIPPDEVHSLRPIGGGSIHCFCFAVAVAGAPEIDYTTHE